ncbi:type I-U CRISPR-associated helicase/endonuclease Cas3 [uncultured Desulfuromonas sp.]|uniref:type I-G CRISPR-associated helicase/endonuclease Cas3g n=1 Tax=uncultured Desulfuromonas sp. TaxID=181013 RepID=UPI002AAAAB1F|nr:type I-U CRISPR-associated helicase/endonuclease Cas3 [uncultured Desulfuromonas sp.]
MEIDFIGWYENSHGYKPFPWQVRLAEQIAAGEPPEYVSAPTSAGKTAIIAVWQWATENGYNVAKRLIYIVDRRLIVDSVTDYAESLGCHVVKMRGGTTVDDSWMMDPLEPRVIVSTVDQAGSRLLWRGYGVSAKVAPIHAALIGNDALIVLDEAHISTPFLITLQAVQKLRMNSDPPWHVVAMTATPGREVSSLTLDEADYVHPVLRKRLESRKLARLVSVEKSGFVTQLVREAKALQLACNGVVGVICNYAEQARKVFNRLDGEKVLLTGRVRPADKGRILNKYLPRMECGSRENRKPLFVVATQAIEVGADLDFDALVTQSAPIDSLRQRFGRLDRLGELEESLAVIVHKKLLSDDECPVYGKKLLNGTYAWLKRAQTKNGKLKGVDFGISVMDTTIASQPPPLRAPVEVRPFTAVNLRQLRQTEPPVRVDIAPWLHGESRDDISVSVVWRADLGKDENRWAEIVGAAPPVMDEAMPCPVYTVRKWLRNRPALADSQIVSGEQINPGNFLVVPVDYGGYDEWGWDANSHTPVEDIGNQTGAKVRLIGADENTNVQEALDRLGIKITNPVATPYAAGLVISSLNRRTKDKAVDLETHLVEVGKVAEELSANDTVRKAAYAHDLGKSDPRFQVMLGAQDIPLAKSAHPSPWAAKVALEWSGLPKDWRHEIASLAMLPSDASELLRYLVATHHGYARTILPVGGDPALWSNAGGPRWGNMTEKLNQEHGAWELAYMEALVRLADWKQSQQEQRDGI